MYVSLLWIFNFIFIIIKLFRYWTTVIFVNILEFFFWVVNNHKRISVSERTQEHRHWNIENIHKMSIYEWNLRIYGICFFLYFLWVCVYVFCRSHWVSLSSAFYIEELSNSLGQFQLKSKFIIFGGNIFIKIWQTNKENNKENSTNKKVS